MNFKSCSGETLYSSGFSTSPSTKTSGEIFLEMIILGYRLRKSNCTKFSCNPLSGSSTKPPSLSSAFARSVKLDPCLFGTTSLSKWACFTKNHSAC